MIRDQNNRVVKHESSQLRWKKVPKPSWLRTQPLLLLLWCDDSEEIITFGLTPIILLSESERLPQMSTSQNKFHQFSLSCDQDNNYRNHAKKHVSAHVMKRHATDENWCFCLFESWICGLGVQESYLSICDLVGLSSFYITAIWCPLAWYYCYTMTAEVSLDFWTPRGATSSASRSVRFPMAFQNRWYFNVSNMMFKCLKICLAPAGSWPDLVITYYRYCS